MTGPYLSMPSRGEENREDQIRTVNHRLKLRNIDESERLR